VAGVEYQRFLLARAARIQAGPVLHVVLPQIRSRPVKVPIGTRRTSRMEL
jgi:hypothetical protein